MDLLVYMGLCHKKGGKSVLSERSEEEKIKADIFFLIYDYFLSNCFSPEKSFISSACCRFRFLTKVGFRFRFRFRFCAHA